MDIAFVEFILKLQVMVPLTDIVDVPEFPFASMVVVPENTLPAVAVIFPRNFKLLLLTVSVPPVPVCSIFPAIMQSSASVMVIFAPVMDNDPVNTFPFDVIVAGVPFHDQLPVPANVIPDPQVTLPVVVIVFVSVQVPVHPFSTVIVAQADETFTVIFAAPLPGDVINTSSPATGNDAPDAPPSDADQFVVLFQFPVPPATKYLVRQSACKERSKRNAENMSFFFMAH